ncbi:hypothetical protein ACHAPD_009177 [Fusarium lateritium]
MAVVKRGIPKQQYMRVDEKVLYWIGVRKPASDAPSNLGYQSLLLALSDQMLAVGLCYLIAMYVQVCKVSLYSFHIGAQLGYLSSSVHLCTLLVLKSYFKKHPKQAILRGAIMMLFMGLLVATLILDLTTLLEPSKRLFVCGLHNPISPRLGIPALRNVDTKELFTVSFGQIMPMLLLIVIALTVVEVGTIKNFRVIEIETEMKKHPASIHVPPSLEGSAASSSRAMSQGTQRNLTNIAEGGPSKTYGNSLMPMASASYSQPDLSSNAGFGSRVDSMTRWMTPRRTNTLEIEEGKTFLFPSQESTADVLDIALTNAKAVTYTAICAILFFAAGLIVLVFFFYEFAVPAAAGLLFISFIIDLFWSIRGVNEVKREQIEKETRM